MVKIIVMYVLLVAQVSAEPLQYVAMGDSYTIGHNVDVAQRFPNQLVAKLNESGLQIHLKRNIARTGWTTQDLIEQGLPIFKTSKPTFSTLLIGVNDWVQGVSIEQFTQNIQVLLDEMLVTLPNKNCLLVVTIPDFSAAPQGKNYGGGRNISVGIHAFNFMIKAAAKERGIAVVDIFNLSQGMSLNTDLVSSDGLHPSAKEYSRWVTKMLPKVKPL
ncbi:MAG: SGNH/GDSL hydrolase family protein [Methylococcales bacterium]|jgi:acyl-CoA thioesterase I|nr:SGNH/GDSL hydrolase family protein [Methylococcales bacterium]MBT7444166.1 SGNH/GDSL hydrolase family protein [Methylococcales bacterium]